MIVEYCNVHYYKYVILYLSCQLIKLGTCNNNTNKCNDLTTDKYITKTVILQL